MSASRAPLFTAVGILTAGLLLSSLYAIFAVAPVEAQMGIVQKIFYFHVPSAYAMYVGFVVSAIGSAGYLFRRRPAWDALGVAGAEVGLLFCAIVLVSGPLWARKAWGQWWVWDPRLTTTLLAGLVYVAYAALRSFGEAGEVERRFAAGAALLGSTLLPVIHYSVQRWRGQHPTVITNKGGGLDADMGMALGVSFVAFTFLVVLLIWIRARLERLKQRLQEIELTDAEHGLLEDA
jgi:heme exporter protein C